MNRFTPNRFGDRNAAVKPAEQFQFPDLSQTGQHRIVADNDHKAVLRNSNELRASARISSADCPGHTLWRLSTDCASQRDSNSSNLRTCSSESTSFEYASAAKASSAARPTFWNPAPSSSAKSSGMFTVKIIGCKLPRPTQSRKPKNPAPIKAVVDNLAGTNWKTSAMPPAPPCRRSSASDSSASGRRAKSPRTLPTTAPSLNPSSNSVALPKPERSLFRNQDTSVGVCRSFGLGIAGLGAFTCP